MTAHVLSSTDLSRWVERFVVTGVSSPLDTGTLGALKDFRLEPFAYSMLEPHHPVRPALKGAYAAAAARHLAVRGAVYALVRAWKHAGIDTLLFKGFYLAEFVYPIPWQRFYSDVDVLILPQRAILAAEVAAELGWQPRWVAGRDTDMHSPRHETYAGHELLLLHHRDLGIRLDVHRRIVHNLNNRVPWFRRQSRITEQALASAIRRDLEDGEVLELTPTDSILIGLVLNRAWSRDAWRPKAHDYLDFRYLVDRFNVGLGELRRRAAGLGCSRTLERFLRRCNPFEGRFELTPPGLLERQVMSLALLPECGHRGLARALVSATDLPRDAVETLRTLPTVARIARRLSQGASIEAIASASSTPIDEPRTLGHADWRRLCLSVSRAGKLLLVPAELKGVVMIASLCSLARSRRCPVDIARNANSIWLEHQGKRLGLEVSFNEDTRAHLSCLR